MSTMKRLNSQHSSFHLGDKVVAKPKKKTCLKEKDETENDAIEEPKFNDSEAIIKLQMVIACMQKTNVSIIQFEHLMT
jgi:hypothetical protein